MRNELLRGLPPENKLSALERKSRVLKFKAFAKDLLSVRKTEGHKARSAAECIVPYINDRLELLEMETQYAVLWRRIKLLRARTIGKSNSSHVSRILMEVVRRGCDITKRDQKNALRSTKKKITALICVFRSKWASDSTGSGTRFRLKRDMIPLGSGPHFGLERNAVPHGTESRPAWNGTGDGGVESEQAALVIPGRCFPEVKGEYFARTEITHEKNTRNPTPPF